MYGAPKFTLNLIEQRKGVLEKTKITFLEAMKRFIYKKYLNYFFIFRYNFFSA